MALSTQEIDAIQWRKDQEFRTQDAIWAARIGGELIKAYPGHGWEVVVDIKNGICNIFNRHMSPTVGYRLKLNEICLDTLTRDLVRIGGEILERFGLARDKFEADVIREIQHNTHGQAKADLS
ncbi:MAG: hypothetical protein DRQ42_08725 [Gammaproteobacteria bacterium]|nr:MAG: hypothetical protein DRQ42_08725 [Gammaproteobacteria bacterium]